MRYVGGLRPDDAQVGRFSSLGLFITKGFLTETVYFLLGVYITQQCPNDTGHLHIRMNMCCTKEGPWGEQCLSTDTATLYNKFS